MKMRPEQTRSLRIRLKRRREKRGQEEDQEQRKADQFSAEPLTGHRLLMLTAG